MLLALISIIGYLMTILSTVVIVQFILSLLIGFIEKQPFGIGRGLGFGEINTFGTISLFEPDAA